MRHESYGRRTTDVAVCVASLVERNCSALSVHFAYGPEVCMKSENYITLMSGKLNYSFQNNWE
jgi:hypothetical protein